MKAIIIKAHKHVFDSCTRNYRKKNTVLLYLDSCLFNRPFDDQSQLTIQLETRIKLGIQAKIEKNEHGLAWSYVLDLENTEDSCIKRRNTIAAWKRRSSIFQPEMPDVVSRAAEYQSLGLKKNDALHLACSVALKCDYFITTDKGILNKQQQIAAIRIVNPVEFIRETKG